MLDFLLKLKEWKLISKIIASGLFIGYVPIFSSTLGSFIGAIIVFFLRNHIILLILSIILFGLGVLAADYFGKMTGKADNRVIIIDEIVGMMVSLLFIPITIYWIISGFIIFRILDISKLPPANIIDKKLKNGLGVMGDDLISAIYTNILLHLMVRAYY